MPTLVTGATGFVGVNLVRALTAQGEKVRALVRSSSPRSALDGLDVEFAVGDVTDAESVRAAMEGCDRVYHLAGWVQITPWDALGARRINVVGVENVCRACVTCRVERLVHVSSIAAVGHGPMDAPVDETAEWNFQSLRAPYYDTKRDGELVVRRYVDDGLDAVIVNPGYVVGPYDIKPTSGRVILRVATRRMPGVPSRGGIAFVDVRQVVEGMQAGMARGETGQRYLLVGENISYADFVARVARITGVRAPSVRWPFWSLWPAAAICDVVARWKPEKFTDVNTAILRTSFCDQYLDGSKAHRELGIAHWPIDRAVSDAFEWFQEVGYVRRVGGGWSSDVL